MTFTTCWISRNKRNDCEIEKTSSWHNFLVEKHSYQEQMLLPTTKKNKGACRELQDRCRRVELSMVQKKVPSFRKQTTMIYWTKCSKTIAARKQKMHKQRFNWDSIPIQVSTITPMQRYLSLDRWSRHASYCQCSFFMVPSPIGHVMLRNLPSL